MGVYTLVLTSRAAHGQPRRARAARAADRKDGVNDMKLILTRNRACVCGQDGRDTIFVDVGMRASEIALIK